MLTILQIQNPAMSPGTGSFASHSFEIILICLVMFLLGWLLHQFIYGSKYKSQIADLDMNLNSAQTRINDLEGDLESCNAAVINAKGENAALKAKLTKLSQEGVSVDDTTGELPELGPGEEPSPIAEFDADENMIAGLATDLSQGSRGFDAESARTVFGKHVTEDDLQIVEGIGPKTETVLNDNGIHTWRQLGSTSVPQLQSILEVAGERYKLLNPGTWPKQARMAADGEWRKLRDYQEFLIGGVEPTAAHLDSTSVTYTLMGKEFRHDDLTIVEGIGPKIRELLHSRHIDTWLALAESDADQLREILHSAGEHYQIHDPETWPRQARMAYEKQWDELLAYQDYLKGGRDPGK